MARAGVKAGSGRVVGRFIVQGDTGGTERLMKAQPGAASVVIALPWPGMSITLRSAARVGD